MARVTIVMYHYVRDLEHSAYPDIKGLRLDLFKEQLAYIVKYYTVIRMEELIGALKRGLPIPENAALLTFDDGYLDHYTNVFPILNGLGIQGSFFPPVKAVMEHKVLDVNKIHFVLATAPDKAALAKELMDLIDEFRKEYNLRQNKDYYLEFAVKGRFDDADVAFIKTMLQMALPEKVRSAIVDTLFRKYVAKSEEVFSRDLYMSLDQIRCMQRNGMYIGAHGYAHNWLSTLNRAEQESEIDRSLDFLRLIGGNTNEWAFNYPYGDYNHSVTELLEHKGCSLALTTDVDIANISFHNRLLLPRLDTNNLPKGSNAPPNEWTLKATEPLSP